MRSRQTVVVLRTCSSAHNFKRADKAIESAFPLLEPVDLRMWTISQEHFTLNENSNVLFSVIGRWICV